MKALTVRQPWAWAIVFGGKDVENRSVNVAGAYRGPVAIHASLTWSEEGADSELVQRAYAKWLGFTHWGGLYGGHTAMPIDPEGERDATLLDRGAIIGVVDLVNEHGSPVGSRCCTEWAEPDAHHLVLANPRPLLKPVPCRGRLGLWTLPDEILDLLIIETATG